MGEQGNGGRKGREIGEGEERRGGGGGGRGKAREREDKLSLFFLPSPFPFDDIINIITSEDMENMPQIVF